VSDCHLSLGLHAAVALAVARTSGGADGALHEILERCAALDVRLSVDLAMPLAMALAEEERDLALLDAAHLDASHSVGRATAWCHPEVRAMDPAPGARMSRVQSALCK